MYLNPHLEAQMRGTSRGQLSLVFNENNQHDSFVKLMRAMDVYVWPSGPRWPQLISVCVCVFLMERGRLNEFSPSPLNESQAHLISLAVALKKEK